MAIKYELDDEEVRNWRLSKLFDLRSFIGALFLIFGVLVTVAGLATGPADLAKSAGLNIRLWVGGFMLALGLIFLTWLIVKPPPPVTKKEMEAARRAREEMGTSTGLHH